MKSIGEMNSSAVSIQEGEKRGEGGGGRGVIGWGKTTTGIGLLSTPSLIVGQKLLLFDFSPKVFNSLFTIIVFNSHF